MTPACSIGIHNICSGWEKPLQGWQCPLCKVVHSPDVKECGCEKEEPILDAMDGPDWCIGSD